MRADGPAEAVNLDPPRQPVGVYRIDPDASEVQVRGRALGMLPVRCAFGHVTGLLRLTDGVRASTVEVRARSASLDAPGPIGRLLRTSRFLDAGRFPEVVFRGDRVERVAADTYLLTGLLKVRGASRPKTFAVRHRAVSREGAGQARVRFTAHAQIDRRAFGVPPSERTVLWGAAASRTVRVRALLEAVLTGTGEPD